MPYYPATGLNQKVLRTVARDKKRLRCFQRKKARDRNRAEQGEILLLIRNIMSLSPMRYFKIWPQNYSTSPGHATVPPPNMSSRGVRSSELVPCCRRLCLVVVGGRMKHMPQTAVPVDSTLISHVEKMVWASQILIDDWWT